MISLGFYEILQLLKGKQYNVMSKVLIQEYIISISKSSWTLDHKEITSAESDPCSPEVQLVVIRQAQ